MGKHTPLRLPHDAKAQPAIITAWADALNTRIRAVEKQADITQTTANKAVTTVTASIPGPFANDAAAASGGVALYSPYYQSSGAVVVRLS